MRTSVLIAIAIAVGLGACGGPPNSLEGSISESFSLDFDEVKVFRQGLTLRIEYLKSLAGTTNKICKIVVATEDTDLKSGKTVKGDLFAEIVTIQRVANTGGDFPEVNEGEVHFESYKFEGGGRIDGDFDVGFKNGRTLSGNFDGTVENISLD